MIALPTSPTAATVVDPKVLILYGPPKVGKTTILSRLPNNLIVDCEEGTDYISALAVKVHNPQELNELTAALKKQIAETGKTPYDFISIDTISTVEDWAEQVGTEKYKANPTGKNFTGQSVLELPHGHGYLWLRLAFQELIGQFSGTTTKLILVAHLREKELAKPGIEVNQKDLELTGKIRNIVASRADAIGYIYRGADNVLMVSFMTTENVACGSRCAHLGGQRFAFDWKKIYTQLK